MFSKSNPEWGCRCCISAEGGEKAMQWNIYTVNKTFETYKKSYYQIKAKVDTIKSIINQSKAQVTEEEASFNVVELNTDELAGIKDAI